MENTNIESDNKAQEELNFELRYKTLIAQTITIFIGIAGGTFFLTSNILASGLFGLAATSFSFGVGSLLITIARKK